MEYQIELPMWLFSTQVSNTIRLYLSLVLSTLCIRIIHLEIKLMKIKSRRKEIQNCQISTLLRLVVTLSN